MLVKYRYSCKGAALAAANYLKSFGIDAAPKFINGAWRVEVYKVPRRDNS